VRDPGREGWPRQVGRHVVDGGELAARARQVGERRVTKIWPRLLKSGV